MDPVTITHKKSGAKAVVHPFGATVVSFCPAAQGDADGNERGEMLFVSKLAKRDGSKAIRGGIPLAFPQFGQPDKSMPQHGFLRNNMWTVGKLYDDGDGTDDSASCCEFHLSLKDVVNGRGGVWAKDTTKYDCQLTLIVKVQATKLITVLTVTNEGKTAFDFQALFHTYYKVEGGHALNKEACFVKGLGGYSVKDQITSNKYVITNDETEIFVDREVDRIYTPPAAKPRLNLTLQTSKLHKTNISAMALVNGVITPVSVVVWNPHVEKAKGMGDFGDEEYHDMICVEPGILTEIPSLEPGKKGVFEQIISAL
jgi:glucose-6-phosphate 1-epimerase